jgi:uncharacterized protein YbaP (TraB family)
MMSLLTLCCLFATLVPDAVAEAPVEDESRIRRPFLWRIEPAEPEGKPSWLFGTIHVPDKEFTTLHPDAQQAFDAADAAYFEIDFLANIEAQKKSIELPDGQKLEDLIPADLVAQLDARLKKLAPAMSREALPNVHVAVWPLLLGNLEAQIRSHGQPPLDLSLYLSARAASKNVGGLEDPGEQLTALTGLPVEEQIQFLQASLNGMDADEAAGIDRLKETMDKYATGDAEELAEFLESELKRIELSEELVEKITTALLAQRNARMAESIDRLKQDAPDDSFFLRCRRGSSDR